MRSEKRHLTGGKELQDQEIIRILVEMETSKKFGILEADTIKQGNKKLKNLWKVFMGNEKTTGKQTI